MGCESLMCESTPNGGCERGCECSCELIQVKEFCPPPPHTYKINQHLYPHTHIRKLSGGVGCESRTAPRVVRVAQIWALRQSLALVRLVMAPKKWTSGKNLSRLVMINRNKKIYTPEMAKLLSKYFQKFSKAGKLAFEEETLGLETPDSPEPDY